MYVLTISYVTTIPSPEPHARAGDRPTVPFAPDTVLLISGTAALYVDTVALPGATTYEKQTVVTQARTRKAAGKK
jgi:hypothetical protein